MKKKKSIIIKRYFHSRKKFLSYRVWNFKNFYHKILDLIAIIIIIKVLILKFLNKLIIQIKKKVIYKYINI